MSNARARQLRASPCKGKTSESQTTAAVHSLGLQWTHAKASYVSVRPKKTCCVNRHSYLMAVVLLANDEFLLPPACQSIWPAISQEDTLRHPDCSLTELIPAQGSSGIHASTKHFDVSRDVILSRITPGFNASASSEVGDPHQNPQLQHRKLMTA